VKAGEQYIRLLPRESVVKTFQGELQVPEEYLCHDSAFSLKEIKRYALHYAMDQWRWPFLGNYSKSQLPIPFNLATEIEMTEFAHFIEAVFELRGGVLETRENVTEARESEGTFKTTALQVIPYYFNLCMSESTTSRVNIHQAIHQMTQASKLLLSTVMITELLGMADLTGPRVKIQAAMGYSIKDMGYVTSEMVGLFEPQVLEQARRYGVLLYFSKKITAIPTKYFLTERAPVQDNRTFKSLLMRRRSVQPIAVTQVAPQTYVATVKRGDEIYQSSEASSMREAEEEVARVALSSIEGPEPAIQFFRRTLEGGKAEVINVTHEPYISSRYKLGFSAEIPKADWDDVRVDLLPLNDNGVVIKDQCLACKHLTTHSLSVYLGKANAYVQTKYVFGVTGTISFNGCMGPHCGRHTPQVYSLAITAGKYAWRALLCVSHHLERRGQTDKAREYFVRVNTAVRNVYVATNRIQSNTSQAQQGPTTTVVHKGSGGYLRVSAANSSDSDDEIAKKELRDSEEQERRRPAAPWRRKENRPVVPTMNSPARILLDAVNIDDFTNYLKLYCAKSYAMHNGNSGITVAYLSIADAMVDYAQMGAGGFPVQDVRMITSSQLLDIARSGTLISHNHEEPPLVASTFTPQGVRRPMIVEKMCECVGECTTDCILNRS
jgi:hypothetical protein